MDGKEESSTMEKRLEDLDKILDEYEVRLGISQQTLEANEQSVTNEVVNMAYSQLQKLSPRDCGEKAFVLQRYALHIQRAINREQTRVRWTEENIRALITPRLTQQRGTSFEERRLLAIREDDAAKKLDSIRVKAQLRIERLSFLTNRIDSMAKALLNIQQRGN